MRRLARFLPAVRFMPAILVFALLFATLLTMLFVGHAGGIFADGDDFKY